MTRNRRLAYLALLGNVLIWGAALPIVKPALDVISPFYFLLLRYLVASAVMAPILVFIWPDRLTVKQLLTIIGLEFLQITVSLSILYQALALTSALTASLIGSSAPIFITLGGIYFLKERQERREWLGLSLSVTGTVFLILASFAVNGSGGTTKLLGISLLLGYQLINMAYLLLAKTLYHDLNKLFIAGVGCLVGLVSFLILAPLMGPIVPLTDLTQSPSVLFAVLYMGILGSPVAVSLYLYGQARIEASEASLFTYLQPLVYLPLTTLWLGEKLSLYQLLGLILIALGVFWAEHRPAQRGKGT